MKISIALGAAVAALALGGVAQASLVNAPVPASAYIVYDGLDWAWAAPCAATQPSCGTVDLSYEAQFGWRLPTAAEIANAPTADDFLRAGGNVPYNGVDPVSGAYFDFTGGDYNILQSAGSLASPYFNDFYPWGDFCNAPGSNCGFGEVPWSPSANAVSYSESLVVRSATPEPTTWALLLVGFGGLGAAMRAQRRKQAFAAV